LVLCAHPAASDRRPALSVLHGDAEALPDLAEHVVVGHHHAAELELRLRAAADPHLARRPTTRKPARSGRTMNAVGRVGRPAVLAHGGVCANTVITAARCARPIQCLRPVIAQPPSTRSARVTMCCASLPVSGSVSA
jgi:hypothetical protein